MGQDNLSANALQLINAFKTAINSSEYGDKNINVETEKEKERLQTLLSDALANKLISAEDYMAYNSSVATDTFEQKAKEVPAAETQEVKPQVVTNPQTKAETKQGKSDARYEAAGAKTYIKDIVKNKDVTLSMMMNQWDNHFTSSYDNSKDEISTLVSAMGDYSTKDAVAKLEQTVRKNLGKNMTQLQREVLHDMVELAKRENIVNAATQLCDKYEEVKHQAGVDNKTKTYAELYNDTTAQVTGNDYLTESVQVLIKYIKKDAYETYLEELRTIRQEGKLTSADDIIAALNKKYANDKIMLDVIKENEAVYRNNHKEGPADIVARGNKSDERQVDLSHITSRDDLKELAKTNPGLEFKVWSYLNQEANKNEDGTFSMDNLYQIVKDRSGMDHFSNKSRFELLDEMKHIQEDAGFDKLHLTKNEEKQLLKFMDRQYAKNTHYWSDALGTTDYVKEGAEGAIAALPGVTKHVINVTVDVQQNWGTAAEALISAINENGGSASLGGNKVHILINDVSWSGVVGALTAPAAAILFTILYKHAVGQAPDENPCTNLANDLSKIKEECGDDPEKLKSYIAKRHSAKAVDTLGKLIDAYKVMNNGKFSIDGFVTSITKMGGSGSLANCQELLGGYLESEVKVEETEETEEEEDDDQTESKPEYNLNLDKKPIDVQVCYNTMDIVKGDTWSTIIHTYYAETLSQKGWKETIAALRKELGAKADDNDLPYLTRTENGKKVRYLDLPCELLGIKNHMGDLDANRGKYNIKDESKYATGEIRRSNGKSFVGIKRSVTGYYAWDNDNKDAQGKPIYYWGNTPEEAVGKLEAATKKTYKNRDEKIAEFTK